MKRTTFSIPATDGHQIPCRRWTPTDSQTIEANVLISHGMAEHSKRYDHVAAALTTRGFQVFALDHRGHGEAIPQGVEGLYAEASGWDKVTGDLETVSQYIHQNTPRLPVFLLAHSMGSFIAMGHLIRTQLPYRGVALSGSNYSPPLKYQAALRLAKLERLRQGPTGCSRLLDFLSFGSFNNEFKPTQTDFDWLSRDPKEVIKYIDDPQCGFVCSNQLWIDLLGGLIEISSPSGFDKFGSKQPVYIFGGDRDPVSSNGKGLSKLASMFIKHGNKDVKLKIYPEGRHEMVNEINCDEVIHELTDWCQTLLNKA